MSDRFTPLLSDYLDHDLPRSEYEALELHLESCAECRDVLAGLAAVKSHAASLVDPLAPDDLWAGIASRIGTAGSASEAPRPVVIELPRRSRSRWGVPQWLPIAAAFAVVALGAVWFAQGRLASRSAPGGVAQLRAVPSQPELQATQAAGFDADRIEGEIQDLRSALERGRGKLAPETVQVLEENLRIIDRALSDARTALQQDPANRELREYFAGSVQRKLDMVKRSAELAGV